MCERFCEKDSRTDLWKRVYNENQNELARQITKVYEVISITTVIMSGLSVSFMVKNTKDNVPLQIVSTVAICVSLFTLIFSIIIIAMVNARERRNYLQFIDEWVKTFIFPIVGVIISSFLTLISLLLYISYDISMYILPIVTIGVFVMLSFYCNKRTSLLRYNGI